MKESVLAAWKLVLSFRKQDWEFRDYPVVIRAQNTAPSADLASPRFGAYRYVARIVDWPLPGGGDSRPDALRELAASFESVAAERRSKGIRLPRPGTKVPIQFATQERINAHCDLVDDFIRRVLGLDWAWISDESSLWDFHSNESNESLQAKVREVYGVDVSDIEYGNLAQILDRIAATRS